ncbi:MAG: threonine--tRNA ligase [Candidatus Cloacimonadales bacterium]|jgi:threonyl-tRNA synthetase|nr:threonine--tRNA ligase [Candidatus Cloacimonadota bacterium]MDD3501125.1 threonine--tRNA ligase [Candidatus Cloacimonadota bacterium]MDX9977243.1 threonine--tRNA ligase [Candidatus Cloacimonadales bacterium]
MINITFPDKSIKEFPQGITPEDIAKGISHNLALRVVAAEFNGKMIDYNQKLNNDGELILHTFDSDKGKEVFWHSSSHLMAQAVKELYPEVLVTIGPAIENGFYYDFDRDTAFTDEELEDIENKMYELSKQDLVYTRQEINRNEAIDLFKKTGDIYKVEILEGIPEEETISMYTQGTFTDLCRGPHIINTGKLKAFKLLRTSGAYWRGDEKNKMLKRIYGISFPTKKELNEYLQKIEEAKKRDHRKIGKELDLFSVSDNIGAGLVLWHPNGAMMRHIIESHWKERHLQSGYSLVNTPHIGLSDLWVRSGHLGFYSDAMYSPMKIDEQDYYIKPMNCPFHIEIYNSQKRSYRELPIRYCELGTVYRYERSGVLHGLMRVRGFTQDDAHIICTSDQLMDEIEKTVEFSISMLNDFGFKDFQIFLSTKPEKPVGSDEEWEKATNALESALKKLGLEYDVDEGGGAFYGPKIDIKIKDALGRSWQCSTVQFDFNEPTRFNMEYIGTDNQAHRPYMVHRALLGSIERFFGTLIEFYAGNFPTWLCPTQGIILAISEGTHHYARRIQRRFLDQNIRMELDTRNEKIGYKIREAEMRKIPYILIIGEKEEDSNTVSLRRHTKGDLGSKEINEVINMMKEDIDSKGESLTE